MKLSAPQLSAYRRDGVLSLPGLLDPAEVTVLREAYERDSAVPGEHRVLEPGGATVRAVYASHERRPEFARLVRLPRLLEPVRQILGAHAYIYQHKINSKSPFTGSGWSWHQDYAAWRLADNLPRPSLVNIGVFLDDVTEFNGPVVVVPGSHRHGLVKNPAPVDAAASEQHLDPQDIALTPGDMQELVRSGGLRSTAGPAGTVVLFDPEIVHGSAANMSPFPRRLLIITYNEVTNLPSWSGDPRPGYVVGRDTSPLELEDLPIVDAASAVAA